MTGAIEEYRRRYVFLKTIAKQLEAHLADCLVGLGNIDRVTARAKEPDRFAKKALSINSDGSLKYSRALTEIQDQLGARIIVFYQDDVKSVETAIRRYFQPVENRDLVPESQWEFGYFGKHFILPLPGDVVPQGIEVSQVPRFFELQVKTLFQHAWSEAEHELGYKSSKPLSSDQQRLLAFTAAQAWGADRIFSDLWSELRS